jgi:hypothetical protein
MTAALSGADLSAVADELLEQSLIGPALDNISLVLVRPQAAAGS